ncbi:potassium/sodium hyperpolarization-activated cyclic nucleotide-gated channel 1-like [Clytia hemisphaerica]|uniref:potassium/sodium hyperpolarization-activated cyclic nucleotide-gated channel 1-like n=1 Tax=Clytia hemisphaerica TaxID=252671 RepID=UPI0034D54BD9
MSNANRYNVNDASEPPTTLNPINTRFTKNKSFAISADASNSAPAILTAHNSIASGLLSIANFTQTPSQYINKVFLGTRDLNQHRRLSINVLQSNLTRRNTIQRRVRSWIAPANTSANVKIFGGKRAVQIEQQRSKAAGWVIHPYSSLRYYWDLIIMLVLLFNMLVLPLNVAFFSESNTSFVTWIVVHTFSDIVFMLDIVFNFRTGYRKDEPGHFISFVLQPKKIAKNYFKSWFLIDLISSFPFDNIILLISGGNTDSYGLGVKSAFRGFKFLRLVKLLSLLKLLRLSRVMRYVSKYEDFYNLTASVIRYIKLVCMMLMVAHWNGCLGFLVPMLQDFPVDSWVALNNLQEAHWTEQYGWALFKALSHMLCIGYGRFIPRLLSEACITIFSMVTGATFYALFIAHSMAYIQQRDSARRLYSEKFQQIEEYMRYRDLPQNVREKITDYYEHKYSQKRLFNELEILSEVSKPLRDDIVNHNCRDLIECVPFLREGGPDFITQVTNSLTFDVYLAGDIIIKEGTFGDEMFFIRNGSVDVIASGQYVTTLVEGDYFGEITMLTSARRVATITAVTVCDLFILTADNLNKTLEEFPEMRAVMEKVALNRLLRLREKLPECTNTHSATVDLKKKPRFESASSCTTRNMSTIINEATDIISKSTTNIANPKNNQVSPAPHNFPAVPTINVSGSNGNIAVNKDTPDKQETGELSNTESSKKDPHVVV